MSKIRSQNTHIEILVFRALRKRKIYIQKHYKKAIGNPDIALPRKRKAIFIDGDFWHGWKYISISRIRRNAYWGPKIAGNIRRDRRNRLRLKKDGWEVLRVWEHDIEKNFDKSLTKIISFLR